MVFSSLIFLFCFFPIFLICYFVPKKRKTRNIVLLIFSLMFYGYGEPIYVILMILSILVNYYIALVMDKSSSKKKWLIIDLVFNLGLLFIFKYTNFFLDNINNIFNLNMNLTINVFFISLIVFIISLITSFILSKIPFIKRLIYVK